jgi:hypothetical protein
VSELELEFFLRLTVSQPNAYSHIVFRQRPSRKRRGDCGTVT